MNLINLPMFAATALVFCLFLLLTIPPFRFRIAKLMLPLSYVIGICVWFNCFAICFAWSIWAVVIGVGLAGVGVVPVAMAACVWNGHWGVLLDTFIFATIAIVSRFTALYLIETAPRTSNQ